MDWEFTPGEPRLSLKLPLEFGGRSYTLPLSGGYTFQPVAAAVASS